VDGDGGGCFRSAAAHLAGLTGALLGWRPDEFWSATPAELASILTAMTPPDQRLDAGLLDRLKEQFPDG
jgi:Phage tail assembly chaperone protein, TAC